MPEYRHFDTITQGVEGPQITQTIEQTFEGSSTLYGSIYIPNAMGSASEEPKLLGTIQVNIADFLADNGSRALIQAVFKRGAVAEDRAIAVTIGSTTYSTSLLLASDSYTTEEPSDETYLVTIELIRAGLNSLTYITSTKCITLIPTEEEVTYNEGIGYTMPLSPAICFWGTNASSNSVVLSSAKLEYYPLNSE